MERTDLKILHHLCTDEPGRGRETGNKDCYRTSFDILLPLDENINQSITWAHHKHDMEDMICWYDGMRCSLSPSHPIHSSSRTGPLHKNLERSITGPLGEGLWRVEGQSRQGRLLKDGMGLEVQRHGRVVAYLVGITLTGRFSKKRKRRTPDAARRFPSLCK